jgi:predicted dehydrogenase
VVICTPNYTHGPMTLQALCAGKHVLVEKPLSLDPAECRSIAEEAEKQGLVVQVGVELRYCDVGQTMRGLIEEGAIGEPVILRTDVWRQWGAPGSWRAEENLSGGLYHELGVHYIDLLSFLAGTPPLWVVATGGVKATGRDLDYAFTTIGYEGGAVAAFGMCLFAAGGGDDVTVQVIGPDGKLVGDITEGRVALWPREGEPEDRSPERGDAEIFGFPGSLESVASFADCVRTGGRPLADARVGERLCGVCEAARASVEAGGRRVDI